MVFRIMGKFYDRLREYEVALVFQTYSVSKTCDFLINFWMEGLSHQIDRVKTHLMCVTREKLEAGSLD